MPDWNGVHPLVVHFPIALLFVAPVFVVIAAARRSRWTPFGASALVLIALGTLSIMVAMSTGEAAEDAAEAVADADAVLDEHEELAERARLIFVGLTVLYAALLLAPRLTAQAATARYAVIANLVFLAPYLAGLAALANTAHEGGRLVHEFGVRAPVAGDRAAAGTDAVTPRGDDTDDDD